MTVPRARRSLLGPLYIIMLVMTGAANDGVKIPIFNTVYYVSRLAMSLIAGVGSLDEQASDYLTLLRSHCSVG